MAAVSLVLLGLIAAAVRLDAPADGTVLYLGWSAWLVWTGSKTGAFLSLTLLPVEAVF